MNSAENNFSSLLPSQSIGRVPREIKILFGFVLVILILVFSQKSSGDIKYLKLAGQTVKVDLAKTPAQQEKGLSGRSGLKENEGMLFVFDKPGKYSFWMKDMKFAIDMIWIGADQKVIYIKKNAKPESYPESYGPNQDAKYVLEVSSGFSDKNNLKIGDSTEFSY